MVPIVEEVTHNEQQRLVLLGAVNWEDVDALQVAGGNDILLAAVKLGKILQEPLRISPNISLKKAPVPGGQISR
eukprot:s64_g5.t1